MVEEFFSKSTSHWRTLFFSNILHGFLRAGPAIYPQCFSVAETFVGKEMTQTKGKAADFFGIIYWPAGKQVFQQIPSLNYLFPPTLFFYFNP